MEGKEELLPGGDANRNHAVSSSIKLDLDPRHDEL
jgi:hypothetical protein